MDNTTTINISATTQKVFIVWATLVTEIWNASSEFSPTEESIDLLPINISNLPNFIIGRLENRNITTNFSSTAARSKTIENFPFVTDSELNTFDVNSSTHSNSSEVGNNTIVMGPVIWTGRKTGIFIVSVCMMFLTISGNLLVILSVVLEKKLQTAFNYYIVNLACVDLNVACSDMVFFIIYSLYEYFPFNFTTCCYWIWNDWVMPFESAATLAAIGIDRLWSVTWTLHYCVNNSGWKSLYIIAATWIYVLIFWIPAFVWDRIHNQEKIGECGWEVANNPIVHIIYMETVFHFVPLTILIVSNARIFYVMKKRMKQIGSHKKVPAGVSVTEVDSINKTGERTTEIVDDIKSTNEKDHRQKRKVKDLDNQESRLASRDKKAFLTLIHIVAAFLICWLPWYTYFLLSPFYPDIFPDWFYTYSTWSTYSNSFVNPIIYGIGNRDFRNVFKKIITFKIYRKVK